MTVGSSIIRLVFGRKLDWTGLGLGQNFRTMSNADPTYNVIFKIPSYSDDEIIKAVSVSLISSLIMRSINRFLIA